MIYENISHVDILFQEWSFLQTIESTDWQLPYELSYAYEGNSIPGICYTKHHALT
jgi:hypothetical protein